MLWRVRSQLLMTYLLGVIPVVLFFVLVFIGYGVLVGQTANYLVHDELNGHAGLVGNSAERLALELFYEEESREGIPQGKSAVIRTAKGTTVYPPDNPINRFPDWSSPGFQGIVHAADGQLYFAAHARAGMGDRQKDVFLMEALDSKLLAQLLKDLGAAQLMVGDRIELRIGTFQNPNVRIVADSEEVSPLPPKQGFWDTELSTGSPFVTRDLATGKNEEQAIAIDTHTSLVIGRLFGTLGNAIAIPAAIMAILAFALLMVECVTVLSRAQLTQSITRTVHDLHMATIKVESGDFSHRIPIHSKDQLSMLAESFNHMTQRIQQLITEVKEKEKLESELEIARQVQAQLFPGEAPALRTLELMGVCNAARVVSGDYYDFIPLTERGAAIVIGDISGKGISAALLMASIQSSLHAQLAISPDHELSTATLVTRLNTQLYENTPPEKYATFFCGLYDDRTGRICYTNAGHVAPILIRNGVVSRLESNGTVVGLFPTFPYEESIVDLETGDLFVAFTDGVTEPENSAGEQFGEDRLSALLLLHQAKTLPDIARIVMDAVDNWTHNPANRDDVTLLLGRRI
jgi:sigma-B regulation protein RsbU (phosphoserine phosphatase)